MSAGQRVAADTGGRVWEVAATGSEETVPTREAPAAIGGATVMTLWNGRRAKAGELVGVRHRMPGIGDDLKVVASGSFVVAEAGVGETVRIATRLGHEICVPRDTQLLRFGGYSRAGDVSEGDFLATARRVEAFGDEALPSEEVELLAYATVGGHSDERSGYLRYREEDPVVARSLVQAARNIAGADTRKAQPRALLPGWPEILISGRSALLLLSRHGLFGKRVGERRAPHAVFALPRDLLALYLGRVWSVRGAMAWQENASGAPSVAGTLYAPNRGVCEDLRHLFSRFGVVCRMKSAAGRSSWRLVMSEAGNLRTFTREVGPYVIGRQSERLAEAAELLPEVGRGNQDVVPAAVWKTVDQARMRAGRTRDYVARAGKVTYGLRNITRPRLGRIADALADADLRRLAEADVLWDRAASVEPGGERRLCVVGAEEPAGPAPFLGSFVGRA